MAKRKWGKEIKAWADGAVIEYRAKHDGGWDDWCKVDEPRWVESAAVEYRVKPEVEQNTTDLEFREEPSTVTTSELFTVTSETDDVGLTVELEGVQMSASFGDCQYEEDDRTLLRIATEHRDIWDTVVMKIRDRIGSEK